MNTNIQRAVLASFLWCDDVGNGSKDAFVMEDSVFDGDRRLIASKVNDITNTEDRHYGLLNLELENTSAAEWMAIAEQTPLPLSVAKRYYDHLVKDRNHKIIIGSVA